MTAIRGGLFLFWTGIVLLIMSASPADSPLRATYRTRRAMLALFPQGWAFFTRDPRESLDRLYRPGTPPEPLLYANSSARSLFGLSRRARAKNVELAALLLHAPSEEWHDCLDSLPRCLEQLPGDAAAVTNTSLTQQICGPVVVERQPPVPWAWGRGLTTVHMPSRVVRFEVRCGMTG